VKRRRARTRLVRDVPAVERLRHFHITAGEAPASRQAASPHTREKMAAAR
jgi:hypothetical protein